jgi:branched-chain amino acid transport system substrate-binding protein
VGAARPGCAAGLSEALRSSPVRRRAPLARWLGLAAIVVAVAWALSGCGVAATSEATGTQLTVYSSLPLQGSTAAAAKRIVDGEKLALSQAGGRAGAFKVSYTSLDDADPTTGQWSPGEAAANAKQAAQDTSTIAYLGDYNSAATAISLPLINGAGILQISPASPYVGLTSSLDAGQDEPERFYLTGRRNFARLQPGDPVQARAQVRLMGQLGIRRVFVLDDQNPFEMPLASIVAGEAGRAGLDVLAHDSIAVEASSNFAGEVEKIVASHAQAVFLAGGPGAGTVALWRRLHEADPGLLLLGSSSMDSEAFTSRLGGAGGKTYLTTPFLPPRLYPASAQRVLEDYRRVFGEGGPEALYGYEAMQLVLDAIKGSGAHGNDRRTVIARVLATRDRDSVLGRYSIEASGETTLATYGVDVVRAGRPVFYRAIDTSAPPR